MAHPIRLLVSTNYQAHFDQATVFTKQLADAGINVQMMVVDWATLLKMRGQADQWDIFVTHHGFVPDPILITFMNDSYAGWWKTPEKTKLTAAFTGTADPAARAKIWAELQALIYEQVPAIKVGDAYSYDIASKKLQRHGRFHRAMAALLERVLLSLCDGNRGGSLRDRITMIRRLVLLRQ